MSDSFEKSWKPGSGITRRSFLVMSAAALPLAAMAKYKTSIPIGIEMYSVRNRLKEDPQGTVREVAKLGYQGLEFYAPYYDWTVQEAKQMRALMDELKIRCFSTHNDLEYLSPEKLGHAAELNHIMGSKYVVLAWADPKTLDDWKKIAETLNTTADKLEPQKLHVGYHNHEQEFKPIEGKRPIDIIAANTKKSITLQLDVGTCMEAGADPVAYIRQNAGRVRSMHCKEWSRDPAKGYKVLFGQGAADWPKIFEAAESVGGIEYYLIEQEEGEGTEIEIAQNSLRAFREMREKG
jgi:sugar phosphate isomerase/epimerase